LLVVLDSGFPGLRDILAMRNHTENAADSDGLTWARRLDQHWRRLQQRGIRAKLEYLKHAVISQLYAQSGGLRKLVRKSICSCYAAVGLRIPRSLRSSDILDIYDDHARRNYAPQRYDGKVFYIKSTERPWDHFRRWSEVMTGGLDMIEITGTHSDIREKSFVGSWATAVKVRLEQSQKEQARDNRDQQSDHGLMPAPGPLKLSK
jgi:hypothetical protein